MKNIKFSNARNCIASAILSSLLLSSCVPTVGRDAGTNLSQERSIGEIRDDLAIKQHIKSEFTKKNKLTSVGVKVSEGRVLLTGKVATQINKLDAATIAWHQLGVKEVNNDIVVINNALQVARDSNITAEIKSKLLVTKNINSMNYSFETIDGVVYVLGIARDSSELERVITVCNEVEGVTNVVNHVRIKKY